MKLDKLNASLVKKIEKIEKANQWLTLIRNVSVVCIGLGVVLLAFNPIELGGKREAYGSVGAVEKIPNGSSGSP